MLFFLKNLESGNTVCLSDNECYRIGRKSDNDIIILERTVSKYHSKITIKNGQAYLKDLNSKRGIFLNETKIEEKTKLKHLDKLKFGLADREYQFLCQSWSTFISNYQEGLLGDLETTLEKCDVAYSMGYSKECSHVTAEKFVMTQENLLALVHKTQFVRPKFWYDLSESIQNMDLCPKVQEYIPTLGPELTEKNIDLSWTLNRSCLFKKKYFVFFDEESKNKVCDLIEACAGSVIEWAKLKIDLKSQVTVKCNPNYLVVYSRSSKSLPQLMTVQKCIETEGLRCIKVKEIFWAVIYGSTEMYCNPLVKIDSEIENPPEPNSSQPHLSSESSILEEAKKNTAPLSSQELVKVLTVQRSLESKSNQHHKTFVPSESSEFQEMKKNTAEENHKHKNFPLSSKKLDKVSIVQTSPDSTTPPMFFEKILEPVENQPNVTNKTSKDPGEITKDLQEILEPNTTNKISKLPSKSVKDIQEILDDLDLIVEDHKGYDSKTTIPSKRKKLSKELKPTKTNSKKVLNPFAVVKNLIDHNPLFLKHEPTTFGENSLIDLTECSEDGDAVRDIKTADIVSANILIENTVTDSSKITNDKDKSLESRDHMTINVCKNDVPSTSKQNEYITEINHNLNEDRVVYIKTTDVVSANITETRVDGPGHMNLDVCKNDVASTSKHNKANENDSLNVCSDDVEYIKTTDVIRANTLTETRVAGSGVTKAKDENLESIDHTNVNVCNNDVPPSTSKQNEYSAKRDHLNLNVHNNDMSSTSNQTDYMTEESDNSNVSIDDVPSTSKQNQHAAKQIDNKSSTPEDVVAEVRGNCDGMCTGIEGECIHEQLENDMYSVKFTNFVESQRRYFTGLGSEQDSDSFCTALNDSQEENDTNQKSQKTTYMAKKPTKVLPDHRKSSEQDKNSFFTAIDLNPLREENENLHTYQKSQKTTYMAKKTTKALPTWILPTNKKSPGSEKINIDLSTTNEIEKTRVPRIRVRTTDSINSLKSLDDSEVLVPSTSKNFGNDDVFPSALKNGGKEPKNDSIRNDWDEALPIGCRKSPIPAISTPIRRAVGWLQKRNKGTSSPGSTKGNEAETSKVTWEVSKDSLRAQRRKTRAKNIDTGSSRASSLRSQTGNRTPTKKDAKPTKGNSQSPSSPKRKTHLSGTKRRKDSSDDFSEKSAQNRCPKVKLTFPASPSVTRVSTRHRPEESKKPSNSQSPSSPKRKMHLSVAKRRKDSSDDSETPKIKLTFPASPMVTRTSTRHRPEESKKPNKQDVAKIQRSPNSKAKPIVTPSSSEESEVEIFPRKSMRKRRVTKKGNVL